MAPQSFHFRAPRRGPDGALLEAEDLVILRREIGLEILEHRVPFFFPLRRVFRVRVCACVCCCCCCVWFVVVVVSFVSFAVSVSVYGIRECSTCRLALSSLACARSDPSAFAFVSPATS